MHSTFTFFTIFLFSLILIASPIDGRKDPGEYWGHVMKGEPIPEPIKLFIQERHNDKNVGNNDNQVKNCDHTKDESFVKEFDPIPNISIYHEDGELKEVVGEIFVKEFDPIPNISVYHDDDVNTKEGKSYIKEFDPIPNISVYHDDDLKEVTAKFFSKDFDPVPNISVYHDDENSKSSQGKSFIKEFDPIPNISVYHDDENLKSQGKSFTKEFDPIPNISIYHNDISLKDLKPQAEDCNSKN